MSDVAGVAGESAAGAAAAAFPLPAGLPGFFAGAASAAPVGVANGVSGDEDAVADVASGSVPGVALPLVEDFRAAETDERALGDFAVVPFPLLFMTGLAVAGVVIAGAAMVSAASSVAASFVEPVGAARGACDGTTDGFARPPRPNAIFFAMSRLNSE